jgi:Holliday junction DNA helicase RuvA
MIGYLEGKLIRRYEDRILLLANQIGYEVLVPAVVMQGINDKAIGDQIALYIYFYQTERQPKPVLIGFHLEAEKEFFQYFISVEAIGPLKAVKALDVPIRDIARAIETGDLSLLKRLKGIGGRTAQKIVASLQGKVEKFALIREADKGQEPISGDFIQQVLDVLVVQLGHRSADAKRMISDAMDRNPGIATPEALFDEVYRGEASKS